MQRLDPARTTWHLTFGTYGARLHGDDRPTVDREMNKPGQAFVEPDPARVAFEPSRMRGNVVYLNAMQRKFIEQVIPEICQRGKWNLRICAAPDEENHVHVMLDALPALDPDAILKTLARRGTDRAMGSARRRYVVGEARLHQTR